MIIDDASADTLQSNYEEVLAKLDVLASSAVATHYACLGAPPTASAEQLQHAYRRAAWDAHPDRHGNESSASMAEINEAWRVLGNPARRRAYDDLLGLTTSSSTAGAAAVAPTGVAPTGAAPSGVAPVHAAAAAPGRFRWRLLVSMETLAVAAVVGMLLLTTRFTPDFTLQTGDCVVLRADLPPAEVACAGRHDAVVERRIPFGRSCPAETLPYRDRTGRVCVVPVPAGAPASPSVRLTVVDN